MIRQSKTTIKELTAQYRSVLKRAFIAGVMAVATANSANAEITPSDISAINDSINMVQSDGNYTTSMGDFNAGTTDYSTEAGYGLYTYDHDNNPETPEIALTTNDGSETLDNTVFTYTDNTGATTNLGDNATGFTTSDFTGAAGTIDVADGTTDLTTLEANTTTVGLGNYQYMANFDNSGDALTALTADAPELASFHNDVTLTTGAITVNGNDEVNKPSIDQYGFTVDLHDGSTGNFDLVYNESTHLYSYNYDGDVVLDAADIAAADAQVSSQSANLIADTTLFNTAVATNTTNYNSALGHYNTVHGVYESDTNTQSTLDTNYGNYETSFAEAQTNQATAAGNLSEVQGAYAADLAIYTPVATAYNNYENSLGKSIDAKDETVLANAKEYADGLADNYDAAGSADTAEQNANAYTNEKIDAEVGARNEAIATAKGEAIDEANGYTDGKIAEEVGARNEAIATAKGEAIDEANEYTDGKIAEEVGARNEAIATAKGEAIDEANEYTDGKIAEEVGARNEAIATAKGEANAYTDEQIGTEKTARESADQELQDAIEAEAGRATAAENALRNEFASANAETLARANAYTDKKVDTLEKNVSGGVAAATALSAVSVSNVKRGEVSVGGGYGYYNDQSAVALGATMGLSDNWSVNAGAGVATGDKTQFAIRAGTNYKFKLF